MIEIDVPGFGALSLAHLVLDYNGTLARDGELIDGVAERLRALADTLEIHVLTADTFGTARRALAGLPCAVTVLGAGDQAAAKAAVVERLGPRQVVAIGNGRNDRLMLERAALGIAVILEEGAAAATLRAADVVATRIDDALALLGAPARLTATLRS